MSLFRKRPAHGSNFKSDFYFILFHLIFSLYIYIFLYFLIFLFYPVYVSTLFSYLFSRISFHTGARNLQIYFTINANLPVLDASDSQNQLLQALRNELKNSNPILNKLQFLLDSLPHSEDIRDLQLSYSSVPVNPVADPNCFLPSATDQLCGIVVPVDSHTPSSLRTFTVSTTGKELRQISVTNPFLDCLTMPLLFPHATPGWHPFLRRNNQSSSQFSYSIPALQDLYLAAYNEESSDDEVSIDDEFEISSRSKKRRKVSIYYAETYFSHRARPLQTAHARYPRLS